MRAGRVGGVEVVAEMRACRLDPLPEIRTRRRGMVGVLVAMLGAVRRVNDCCVGYWA